MGSKTAVQQLAPVLRSGEESQQLGDDAAFAFRFLKALREERLAASVLDSLRPLAKAYGLDMEELAFIIETRVPTMRATLEREGIASFSMDCAIAIYLYTINQPKLYEIVNTACHATDRDVGPGGLSPSLSACMPYIKFLDTSLDLLPAKYHFKGRLNRGVKWAFPKPEAHDPEAHFPKGKQFFWYEFKSAAREFKVMYCEAFCGESGPRTIFTIDACESYMIEPFSHYPQEAEALFRPVTQFEVTSTQKRLRAQDLLPNAPNGGFPDEVRLRQIAKPGREDAKKSAPNSGKGCLSCFERQSPTTTNRSERSRESVRVTETPAAPGSQSEQLAQAMARIGLTTADQRRLRQDGVATVGDLKSLRDEDFTAVGIDIDQRRKTKTKADAATAEKTKNQRELEELLATAEISESGRNLLKGRISSIPHLFSLGMQSMKDLGLNIIDRRALDELFGSKNKVLKKARKNLPKLQAALGSSHTVLWLGANDAYEPLSTAEIRWLAAKGCRTLSDVERMGAVDRDVAAALWAGQIAERKRKEAQSRRQEEAERKRREAERQRQQAERQRQEAERKRQEEAERKRRAAEEQLEVEAQIRRRVALAVGGLQSIV